MEQLAWPHFLTGAVTIIVVGFLVYRFKAKKPAPKGGGGGSREKLPADKK